MKNHINLRKVGIIGLGFVGSSIAFTLMQSSMFSEIVLLDADKEKAIGEAMDMSHGLPFIGNKKIYAGEYKDLKDASIIIITAGANQKEGETRLDLVKKNVSIFKSIIPNIKQLDYKGIILVVSNPVDILTYVTLKLSGLNENKVIGSGTTLDTARFKYKLGEHLGVDSRSVHAFIIGEHGDSEIAVWSSANISGIPIHSFCESKGFFNHDEAMIKIASEVKNSAYEIIKRKRATYYGVAMATKRIVEAIILDQKSIIPVSRIINNKYGINDVALSMPAIIGKNGVESEVPISLSKEEENELKKSAETLKNVLKEII